jgi:murein L,D-transpeptidase YcbB/YkuD
VQRYLVLLLIAASTNFAPATASEECTSALCRVLATGRLEGLRWPDLSDCRRTLEDFYRASGNALVWTRNGSVTPQAAMMVDAIRNSAAKGLDPEDYDGSKWTERFARVSPEANEEQLVRFDVAVSIAVIRFVRALHVGRFNPGRFHSTFDIDSEHYDLPGLVRMLAGAGDVRAQLARIDPPFEAYRRAERALERYRALAREDSGELLPVTKKPVDPGNPYPGVARLERLLRLLGDLPASTGVQPGSPNYDGPLVDAVKRFQARHGLTSDGQIGKPTLVRLNTPLSKRVHQLELTLERFRWLPHEFPYPPVIVNIPEFRLRALNPSNLAELEMKVVVGGAYGHQTPIFSAGMKEVIFRPYWNVPRSILVAELLPKIRTDRSYLARNDYEVVTSQERVVSRGDVDDQVLELLSVGKLQVRQVPGLKNALGGVKFIFPNEHNVYLHDTPSVALFSRSRRDFSHGCIRVERPDLLAAWVLRDKPEWTTERIAAAMQGETMLRVPLDREIPVLIVYATAVALGNGEVRFFDDIYKQDAGLDRLLAEGFPYSGRKPTSGARGPRPRE